MSGTPVDHAIVGGFIDFDLAELRQRRLQLLPDPHRDVLGRGQGNQVIEKPVIELQNDLIHHHLRQVIKVDDHASLGIDSPLQQHEEFVTVAVQVPALARVVVDEMGGFEPVFFAQDHGTHNEKAPLRRGPSV